MTDRELLELAAKAAGYEILHWLPDFVGGCRVTRPDLGEGYTSEWAPLDSDGDALRLAVKLGLCVSIKGRATQVWPIPRGGCCEESWSNSTSYAATRRAIVRAAAEIGNSIP